MANRAFLSCVVVAFSAGVLAVPAMAQQATAVADSADYPGGVTRHVIVVSVDGLRPDAIETFAAPSLRRIMREGTYSLLAMTIMPSKTLPSHTSMLTGVGPEVHGITWNSLDDSAPSYVTVPTIFQLAHEAGLSTAAFVAKAKLRHLLNPEHMTYFEAPTGNATNWVATRTVERALNYMRHEQPNLLFLHFAEPDFAGHTVGWMSAPYAWAVGQADAAIGRIIETANALYGRDGYTLIVTADHGGHARTHGSAAAVDRTIPWLVYGAGVLSGVELMPGIRTMDTAATALWALGVSVPEDWAGRPVVSAFEITRRLPVAAAAAP